jgi:hypothetical protein
MLSVHHSAWDARRALEDQVRAMDRQRNALLCQLADFDLANAKEPDWGWGAAPEVRAQIIAKWRAAQDEKIARRAARRTWEREAGLLIRPGIRPGPWDEDLDLYHGETAVHEWDLGDGYTGKVVRGGWHLGWNGYVTVPEGHWAAGKSYEELGMGLTYAADRTFGFDHNGESDVTPLQSVDYEASSHYSGKSRYAPKIYLHNFQEVGYLDRAAVMKEVEQLKRDLLPAEERAALEAREEAEAAEAERKHKADLDELLARLAAEAKAREAAARKSRSWASVVGGKAK